MLEMFKYLGEGFLNCLDLQTILVILAGVAWGILGGAIPGISPSIAIVLALPFTYHMDTVSAVAMLVAVYTGACYGSSIPAILIGVPGAPASAATIADGYELGKKGKGLEALGISLTSGVIGGLIGTLLLCVLAIPLGKVALSFGAPEYFAICILGLSIVAAVGNGSITKALISIVIGLAVAGIGLDSFSGAPRFTFGLSMLNDGVNDVSAMIGVFAVGEIFYSIYKDLQTKKIKMSIRIRIPWDKVKKLLPFTVRGGIIGTIVGVLPGAGSSLAGFVAYADAKNASKHPEEFGKGSFEGVAAPESANNGCVGGSMVPVLALGVPGSSGAAMIMAAFIMHGVVPGPTLFEQHPDIVYTIFAGLFMAQLLLFAVGYLCMKPFLKIIDTNITTLNVIIMILVLTGSFSLSNRLLEPAIVLIFGLLGFWMKLYGYSPSAMVLGLVLGGMLEDELRRSLIMSRGSFSIFFIRPLCLIILILSVASVAYGYMKSSKTAKKAAAQRSASDSDRN